MVMPAPERVEELEPPAEVAYVAGVLGIWGAATPTEATVWSCGQEGCIVRSRHEHEHRVDERLSELRRINAEFERRHPSLKDMSGT